MLVAKTDSVLPLLNAVLDIGAKDSAEPPHGVLSDGPLAAPPARVIPDRSAAYPAGAAITLPRSAGAIGRLSVQTGLATGPNSTAVAWLGADLWPRSGRPPKRYVVVRHLAAFAVSWLGAAVDPHAVRMPRHTVLMHRAKLPRSFDGGTLSLLLGALSSSRRSDGSRREVRVHNGSEPLHEQLRMFAGAESLLGYHGAGFANAVFSRYACAHELSTFKSLLVNDTSDARMWRTNMPAVVRLASTLSWEIHLLPLGQILAASLRDR